MTVTASSSSQVWTQACRVRVRLGYHSLDVWFSEKKWPDLYSARALSSWSAMVYLSTREAKQKGLALFLCFVLKRPQAKMLKLHLWLLTMRHTPDLREFPTLSGCCAKSWSLSYDWTVVEGQGWASSQLSNGFLHYCCVPRLQFYSQIKDCGACTHQSGLFFLGKGKAVRQTDKGTREQNHWVRDWIQGW